MTASTPTRTIETRWLVGGAVALVAVLAVLGAAGLWFYARGGGPLPARLAFLAPRSSDPLAASDAQEVVLRTMRLAGIERAVVGQAGHTVMVRIEVPTADSAADVAVGWQTAAAALSESYPTARRYVVQVFAPGALPLVEYSWSGDALRDARDPAARSKAAAVRLLSEQGGGS